MIEILIVCGIKNQVEYHDNIIKIINNINKDTIITKSLCNFTTLNKTNADIYISDIYDGYFLYNESFIADIFDDNCDEENYEPIKNFNIENNNKFDYIILEHCPVFDLIPEFIKHYNLLKKNGYLIIYVHSHLTPEFNNFKYHKKLPILDTLYSRYKNNIYKKENDDIYDMKTHCENYYNYCVNYNPKLNYADLSTVENKDEDLSLYKNKKLAEELAEKYNNLDKNKKLAEELVEELSEKYKKYKIKYLKKKKENAPNN